MKADSLKYLMDIMESINIVESHIRKTKTLQEYTDSLVLIDAVERRLAIIGEELNKALQLDADISVTDSRKIVGLRHILVHDYDKIDDASIWNILKKNVPVLKEEVRNLIDQHNGIAKY